MYMTFAPSSVTRTPSYRSGTCSCRSCKNGIRPDARGSSVKPRHLHVLAQKVVHFS